MTQPLVSIIIPHYAHGCYLKEAVDSALNQTYENIEVIVVDDCDPNEPAASVLDSINDPRLRLVCHEANMGAAAARNTGIGRARGELILPLDSDDILDLQYLSKTVPLLDRSDVGGVYTALKMFGLDERVIAEDWTIEGILKGSSSAFVCMLYRKQMFNDLGGYDTNWVVGEDSDFFLHACKAGWKIKQLKEPLYFYRRHERSTWQQASSKQRISQSLKQLSIKLAENHNELYAAHLAEIVSYKEKRFWDLNDEYLHLHQEFHKLLELYNNLENGLRLGAAPRPSLIRRIVSRAGKCLNRFSARQRIK